jgi:hypothetical protein
VLQHQLFCFCSVLLCRNAAEALHSAAGGVSKKAPRTSCDALLSGLNNGTTAFASSASTAAAGSGASFVAQGNKIGWLAGERKSSV